jgi:hypothetical protein
MMKYIVILWIVTALAICWSVRFVSQREQRALQEVQVLDYTVTSACPDCAEMDDLLFEEEESATSI